MPEATLPLVEAQIIADLRHLPADKLREARDYIGYLRQRYGATETPDEDRPKRGSAEAVLRHAGAWKLEPGERESILRDIDHFRHMEDN